MPVSIYQHFATCVDLPVPLEEIKSFILNTGLVTVIARYPADMSEVVLKGMLQVFRDCPPYAVEDRVMARIIYPRDAHPYDVRLACCKEMLHLLDNHNATASDRNLVAKLVEEITLPVELSTALPSIVDHAKLAHALCVLLPLAALEPLKAAYVAGKLSTANIASIAEIPEPWVRVALLDNWMDLHKRISGY